MVRKIISLALMVLALLSSQLGPVTMAHASMTPNMVSPTYSMHHGALLSGHHSNHHISIANRASHQHDMSGKCCVFHSSVCDMMVLSQHAALYKYRDGKRVCPNLTAQRLPSFLVPAALRPPISIFA